MSGSRRPPLLVFADDWGRHPSSCQHLVSRMLEHREVVWANTIGTRPVRFDRQTLLRVADRLAAWARLEKRSGNESHTSLATPRVVNLRMWPSFEGPLARSLNRTLIRRQLEPILSALPEPAAALTTLPITADLIGHIEVRSWTYYCVDDFGSWPGYYGATLSTMERDLLGRVDLVVAASKRLAETRRPSGPCPVLTHGVDLERWQVSVDPKVPVEFAQLEPPYILFWGLIDQRLDAGWLKTLARSLCGGTLVLVGPQDAPDPEISRIPRVALLPAVPHARLPVLAAHSSVLIMPYRDIDATRAMQPLKLKEYLATGKPTVVRALPATLEWRDACHLCSDEHDFVAAVHEALRHGLSDGHRIARERLESEGWGLKARVLESLIDSIGKEPTQEQATWRAPRTPAPSIRPAR